LLPTYSTKQTNSRKTENLTSAAKSPGITMVKFNIRFYVVALIFLIFDVEVILLFPWALSYKENGYMDCCRDYLFTCA